MRRLPSWSTLRTRLRDQVSHSCLSRRLGGSVPTTLAGHLRPAPDAGSHVRSTTDSPPPPPPPQYGAPPARRVPHPGSQRRWRSGRWCRHRRLPVLRPRRHRRDHPRPQRQEGDRDFGRSRGGGMATAGVVLGVLALVWMVVSIILSATGRLLLQLRQQLTRRSALGVRAPARRRRPVLRSTVNATRTATSAHDQPAAAAATARSAGVTSPPVDGPARRAARRRPGSAR